MARDIWRVNAIFEDGPVQVLASCNIIAKLTGITEEATIFFNAEYHGSHPIRGIFMTERILKLIAIHFHFLRL